MPRFNGRGPRGMGPGTGWGLGPCGGGRAWGRGVGFGRRGYFAESAPYIAPMQSDPEDEKVFLADQLEYLESEVKAVRRRMDELDKG